MKLYLWSRDGKKCFGTYMLRGYERAPETVEWNNRMFGLTGFLRARPDLSEHFGDPYYFELASPISIGRLELT